MNPGFRKRVDMAADHGGLGLKESSCVRYGFLDGHQLDQRKLHFSV